jgi:FkbM family methyltransferase
LHSNHELEENSVQKKLKKKIIEAVAAVLSRSLNSYKMSKLIIMKRDNDCNGDMLKNGEKRIVDFLIENNLLNVFFDVGANVGEYLSMVLEHRGKPIDIYAFEPGPRNVDILRKRFSNMTNLTIIEKALSHTNGVSDFYQHVDPQMAGSDSIHDMQKIGYDYATTKHSVESITLDKFCEQNGINHVSLMKCDVEGNELAVFIGGQGMLMKDAIDYIQFEFGHAARAARVFLYDIYSFLHGYGYEIFTVKPRGLEKFVYSPWEENKYNMVNFYAVSSKTINTVKKIIV